MTEMEADLLLLQRLIAVCHELRAGDDLDLAQAAARKEELFRAEVQNLQELLKQEHAMFLRADRAAGLIHEDAQGGGR
ncbi:MAG TPA: hypothetical protein VFB04_07705 [Terriglobales bacterium]|nr:hypothetical protein [Terriglobales bacterium]